MVWCPRKWLCQTAHAGGKLFIACLSHALQKRYLLIFESTVDLVVIQIMSAHGHTIGINLSSTSTKQHCTHTAHARCDDETTHDCVHNLVPFPWGVAGCGLEIPAN
jgi:hypothetical protein